MIARVARARRDGYTLVLDEFGDDLAAAAAPVRDGRGRIVAALNVRAPSYRLEDRLDEVGRTVKGAALHLSRRQPAIPWLAVHSGAEVLVVPVNSAAADVGVPTDRAWEIVLLHAAVVLQSYVIFVNRSGQENQRGFWGGSRVIHPSGEVLGRLGHDPGELDCVIDLDELRTLRRRWPLLQESRADLIAKATSQLADEES